MRWVRLSMRESIVRPFFSSTCCRSLQVKRVLAAMSWVVRLLLSEMLPILKQLLSIIFWKVFTKFLSISRFGHPVNAFSYIKNFKLRAECLQTSDTVKSCTGAVKIARNQVLRNASVNSLIVELMQNLLVDPVTHTGLTRLFARWKTNVNWKSSSRWSIGNRVPQESSWKLNVRIMTWGISQ